jgi:hypothetical protein
MWLATRSGCGFLGDGGPRGMVLPVFRLKYNDFLARKICDDVQF